MLHHFWHVTVEALALADRSEYKLFECQRFHLNYLLFHSETNTQTNTQTNKAKAASPKRFDTETTLGAPRRLLRIAG